MTDVAPLITAIVPMRELTALGQRCLTRLAQDPRIEIIAIPHAVPADRVHPRVTWLPSGEATVGAKRQRGLEAASAPLIALVDDDAFPHCTWLEHVLHAFAEDPGVTAVCGPTLTPADEPEAGLVSGAVYANPMVGGPHRWRYAPARAADVPDAPTVNLCVRREAALAVRLDSPYYPGDDTIVCDRLLRAGGRIRNVPGAIMFHSRRPVWRAHLRQVWGFGRHRGAFARYLGGNSRQAAYFAPTALTLGLAGGLLTGGRLRRLWRGGIGAYVLACLATSVSPRPSRWVRLAAAVPATHVTYGVGFLLGFAGVTLPEGPIRRVADVPAPDPGDGAEPPATVVGTA